MRTVTIGNREEDADGLQDVSEQDEHNISSDGSPSEHECHDNVQSSADESVRDGSSVEPSEDNLSTTPDSSFVGSSHRSRQSSKANTGEVVIEGILEEDVVVVLLEGLLVLVAGVVGVLLVLVVEVVLAAEVLLMVVLMLERLDMQVIIAKLVVCQSLMVLGIKRSLQVYSLITTGHLDHRLRLIGIVLPLNFLAVSLLMRCGTYLLRKLTGMQMPIPVLLLMLAHGMIRLSQK